MDPNLLEKYWNAETTPEEEARLMAEAAHETSAEAAYFRLLAQTRGAKSRLTPSDIIGAKPQEGPPHPTAIVRPIIRWAAAAAAVLALVLSGYGLWQYSRQAQDPVQMAETFEDPEAALEEVRLALAYVSSKLNRSQEQAFKQIQKAGEYAEIFN